VKTLVAGWFSFEQGHATAGDLMARDLACEWLAQAGYPFDMATVPPFSGGVDWRQVDPQDYELVVFVCGPFKKGKLEKQFLARFHSQRIIGLNLTLPLDEWNPFDALIERDSSVRANPDIAFLSGQPHVPVVGICLIEYHEGPKVEVERVHALIRGVIASREMAIVEIDTRLDSNLTGLRTPAEIESLIARMDAIVTTRLHGTVLALKNGVPVVAIDPVVGGAKIQRQAETIGWPVVFHAGNMSEHTLRQALDYCLTEAAQAEAAECGRRAIRMAEGVREEFLALLASPERLERAYQARLKNGVVDLYAEEALEARPGPGTPLGSIPGKIYKFFIWIAKGWLKIVCRWAVNR
jgi:hypothetical protein